ncbi:MAG TPA: Ig-like domain-containing protein [Terriglobales bacterium]
MFTLTSYAQVTISSPASGATVSSPVKFVASAKSSTGYSITAMRIYVDSVSKYTVNASSLSTSLSLTTGSHNVTIVAWDSSGKSYSKAETITVSATTTTTSGITVYSPASGSTVGSPVTFNASATSGTSYPITAMRLYVDSVSKYTVNASSLSTSQSLATGSHNVTFVAWDSTGKAYNRSLSIYVSGTTTTTTPGKVTITSPTAGSTVNSPATFTASATPTTGTTISSMTLYVDGTSKYSVNSASLSTSQTLASGSHSIVVKAVDSAGGSYQASETITVATTSTVQHSVTVDWTENSTSVAGFNVYRKASGATSYTKITPTMTTATTFVDYNVTAGATYTYVVTAISNTGTESGYSQPATATVPTP